ncbi:MAG: hypothetical protein ACJ72G_08305 [Friedmanniella sp.]|jgi:hypothetical protein
MNLAIIVAFVVAVFAVLTLAIWASVTLVSDALENGRRRSTRALIAAYPAMLTQADVDAYRG